MIKKSLWLLTMHILVFTDSAICKTKPKIKEEKIIYQSEGIKMNGFVAYDQSYSAKRPVVLVIHEWWGQNDYVRNRVKQLAALGYLAIAIDLYGKGSIAKNPEEALKLASPFYKNSQLAKQRFDAALAKIKTYPVADTNKIAAIGYCFGGAMVLYISSLGENLKGVVSFHGNLFGVQPNADKMKADVLVLHGADDQFVKADEVQKFKRVMDERKLPYTFISYPGATHAFTNPDATKIGKKFNLPIAYNKEADLASFKEMELFFAKIFK